MNNNSISFYCDLLEAERLDFEDIIIHDENNEASSKSETFGEINNVSTCTVYEFVQVAFDTFENTLC